MKRIIRISFILAIMILSNGIPAPALGKSDNSLLDNANKAWLSDFNRNVNDIGRQYTSQAVLILEDGTIVKGTNAINSYYSGKSQDFDKIRSFHTVKRFEIAPNYTYYEAGYFTTSKKETYQQLIIWRKDNDIWLRELEVTVKKERVADDLIAVDEARKKWLALYNASNPPKLADNLYVENATFYHVGVITQGINNSGSTYLAKASPDFQLNLVPQVTIQVNKNTVFEIGKYSLSYAGYYMFVWEKQLDGGWKIAVDVNQVVWL